MKIMILLICLMLIYLLVFSKWSKNTQSFYLKERPVVFGHRGSPTYAVENTLASFKKAIKQGADGLEFDVRCTKDKKLIIFHDKDLFRLTAQNIKIKSLTLPEIKKIKLKGQESIPEIDDIAFLLDRVKIINIEIKSDNIISGFDTIPEVLKFIKNNNLEKKCIVSCFNPLILMKIRFMRPNILTGYLYNKNVPFHSWHNFVWIRRVRPDNLHIHGLLYPILPFSYYPI